jgi:hypothetical protein
MNGVSKPHSSPRSELDPWVPGPYPRETLRRALWDAGIAGVNSHDRANVFWKIRRLCEGHPDLQFGLTGVDVLPFEEVLTLMADAAGFSGDPSHLHGLVQVNPERVLSAFERIGDRLRLAAERGEGVLLATGHPSGLPLLYQATGRLLTRNGAKILRPLEGFTWRYKGRKRQIRYLAGVAVLTDRASSLHTHSPEPMERILEEVTPDLVFADHGFAGAAIEAGVDTVSIADINDPALVVAHHLGRGGPVAVCDDNVQPEDYWPCFQAIAPRFSD